MHLQCQLLGTGVGRSNSRPGWPSLTRPHLRMFEVLGMLADHLPSTYKAVILHITPSPQEAEAGIWWL